MMAPVLLAAKSRNADVRPGTYSWPTSRIPASATSRRVWMLSRGLSRYAKAMMIAVPK